MSLSGNGGGSTPLSVNPIQLQNPIAGQPPLNTSVPQVHIQPPPDVMGQLVKVLGSGNRGVQDAVEAMQAARRGVPAAPSAGAGSPGQSLQQATQVMNLIKMVAGGG